MTFLFSNRKSTLHIFILAALLIDVLNLNARAQGADNRLPVLVELFTSEGCSDCPPADRLLEKLSKEQFVSGVDAIVLSEHVTYWNRLGWRDPFSLELADARQYAYGRQFGLRSVYTPQLVVDGAWQFVGSDERSMRAALSKAVASPKSTLVIEGVDWARNAVTFHVHGQFDAEAHLFVVLAADATRSEVTRGENAGRTLHHVAVVRTMNELNGEAADSRLLRIKVGNSAREGSTDDAMRLVVFATEGKSGRIVAAAEQTLR